MDNNIPLITSNIQKKFPFFGVNKTRELTRLVFEISKRDNISSTEVVNSIQEKSYEKVKEFLLKKDILKLIQYQKKKVFICRM